MAAGGSGGARTDAANGGGRGGDAAAMNVAAMCDRYCDCMANHNQSPCKTRTPANCVSTCNAQSKVWDLQCRIDKCIKARDDYRDQIEGDCKAAIGDQACFDVE